MHASTPAPLTNAQRQRRHRDKRRRELEALRAAAFAAPQERERAAQAQCLAAQLGQATRSAAALQARLDALQACEGELQALREAVRALVPKLSPAAQQVARRHLQDCGAAQWLNRPWPGMAGRGGPAGRRMRC